jgi:hypothetical protein
VAAHLRQRHSRRAETRSTVGRVAADIIRPVVISELAGLAFSAARVVPLLVRSLEERARNRAVAAG